VIKTGPSMTKINLNYTLSVRSYLTVKSGNMHYKDGSVSAFTGK